MTELDKKGKGSGNYQNFDKTRVKLFHTPCDLRLSYKMFDSADSSLSHGLGTGCTSASSKNLQHAISSAIGFILSRGA